jgi:hypothetical protein
MDEASRQVARFLEALRAVVQSEELVGGQDSLRAKLTRRGLSPPSPGFLSLFPLSHPRTGLAIVASVMVTPEKELDFGIALFPHDEGWTIDTDVFLDLWPDGEGQRSMRDFPTRHASTLDDCLTQLQGAVSDLARCDDVLDEIAALGLLGPSDTP